MAYGSVNPTSAYGSIVNVTFTWDQAGLNLLNVIRPQAAHKTATEAAALAAAALCNVKLGWLRGDVSRPVFTSPTSARIGSNRPYAGVENAPFTLISGKPWLTVHGYHDNTPEQNLTGHRRLPGGSGPVGGRFAGSGDVTAVVHQVKHYGTGYLDAVPPVYFSTFFASY